MAKQRAYSFAAVVVIALAAGFAFQADAAFLIFHDEDSWQSALGGGPNLQYNFNSFAANTSFASAALNFGPFSMRAVGEPPAGTDLVVTDNGSPYASMFLDSTRSVVLDFHQPVLAFGADFVSSGLMNFGVGLTGTRGNEIIEGPPEGAQFFGFISTKPFDGISFLFAGPQGFNASVSLDNVSAAAVPEPSSLMLLGVGASVLAVYCARRLRRGRGVSPAQP